MGPRQVEAKPRSGPYDMTIYQTTHTCGGAIMGNDPKTSALNRYLQSWDVANLFVMGATAFPQNAGYNPTGTVGALAFWAADAIINQYLKHPRRAGADMKRAIIAGLLSLLGACTTEAEAAADRQAFDAVARGRYLAILGDCAACHTVPGGKPYAGGLPIETPFGVLIAPNITPDRTTGIGAWTDDEFVGAVSSGIARGGAHPLSGHALHLLYQGRSTGRVGDPRLSQRDRAGVARREEQSAALPRQHARHHGRMGRAVLHAGQVRAGRRKIRRLESGRVSGARARPLRRLSHAEEPCWAATPRVGRSRAARCRVGTRPI